MNFADLPQEAKEELNALYKKMLGVSKEDIEHMHPALKTLAMGIKIEAEELFTVPSQ